MVAAEEGNVEIVELLLQNGANVNASNDVSIVVA
jgi:ankyrin repeat protein